MDAIESEESGWFAPIQVNDKLVKFKIDTGAAVTAMPENKANHMCLGKTQKRLTSAGGHSLNVVGTFEARLQYENRTAYETVYLIAELRQPLLKKPG